MARPKFQTQSEHSVPLFDPNFDSEIRLLIIDCHFIIHRDSYGLPKTLCNSEGFPTYAIRGFLNGFRKELTRFKPTHVACCFDGRSKERIEVSKGEYKSNRHDDSEEKEKLVRQYKPIRQIVEAMGYPVFFDPDHEADDLIGTLAWAYRDANVVVLSRDKDFNRLIRRGVRIVDTTSKKILIKDKDYVLNRYKVKPKDFSKYLALVGDVADNIGKVKGIGPVTAAKWLKTHSGSLKDVLKNEVKKKKHREIIKTGYKLAKINFRALEVPDINDLVKGEGKPKKLKKLLEKYQINQRVTF